MKRILLLIDDEKYILYALERVFEDEGYSILTATSGTEALNLLTQFPVQVIISDQCMPDMTGVALFMQVKKKYPSTIRIILSAYADFNAIRDAINEGAIYKFLNKPWDDEFLRQQVRQAFLIDAERKEKEMQFIRFMNYAKLMGLNTNKSTAPPVSAVELQEALDNEQFVIYYQPIVAADTRRIKAVEALLRWKHPTRGLLMPDQFVPCCEETGKILPIGAWMLQAACQQLKRWHEQGLTDISVAVNISASQLDAPGLVDFICDILNETQIIPSYLELEITESLVMSNIESNIAILQTLRNLGVKLSLDDFGTGYSSLNYLNLLPIDILKIDKSFIKDITTKRNNEKIVSAIIALAKSLHLTIIAEGIENEEQSKMLQEKHCDLMQGYLFSKPVPEKICTPLLINGI